MKKLVKLSCVSLVCLSAVYGHALAMNSIPPNCMNIKNSLPSSQIDGIEGDKLKVSYVYVNGGSPSDSSQPQEYWIAPHQTMLVCGINTGNPYNPWNMLVTAASGNGQPAYPELYMLPTGVWFDADGGMSSNTGSITAKVYYGTQYTTVITLSK